MWIFLKLLKEIHSASIMSSHLFFFFVRQDVDLRDNCCWDILSYNHDHLDHLAMYRNTFSVCFVLYLGHLRAAKIISKCQHYPSCLSEALSAFSRVSGHMRNIFFWLQSATLHPPAGDQISHLVLSREKTWGWSELLAKFRCCVSRLKWPTEPFALRRWWQCWLSKFLRSGPHSTLPSWIQKPSKTRNLKTKQRLRVVWVRIHFKM